MDSARSPRAGVDVGGTFTDVVVIDGAGVRAAKVPSTLDDQGRGVVEGIRAAAGDTPVPLVGHGTTTATNAVLERSVARTVLVVTEGFADLLTIGRQARPSLYDLSAVRPQPLVDRELVVTVRERMGPDGSPVLALNDDEVARVAAAVRDLGAESVAICLLFAYADDQHEQRLATAIAGTAGVPVTTSAALVGEFREYERASTAALNAAVTPVMRRYLGRLAQRLPDATVTVMTSGGGTAALQVAAEAPVHTLLSGPAAGVVAAAAVARSAGFDDAVAFDMGGTSTDVCLIRGGRPALAAEAEIDGLPFRTPAVAIHTVGAGGGSIAWVDEGGALRVGPRSAGARPGPACYGHGGTEPTVTDAHCAAGHLAADAALGGGAVNLDREAALRALQRLPDPRGGERAEGVLTVARATMARALRRVTTEQGVDPRDLALVAYGGAGPLHAAALARELGCAAVVVPPAPGVLSALGLLLAPARAEAARTVMVRLDPAAPLPDLAEIWRELEERARATLRAQQVTAPTFERIADCRYAGQSHELRIPVGAKRDVSDDVGGDVAEDFHAAHRAAYGYAMPDEPVDVVTLRVAAVGAPALDDVPRSWDLPEDGPAEGSRPVLFGGRWWDTPVRARSSLAAGMRVEGPAVVEQADATTVLEPGDTAIVDEAGNLLITPGAAAAPTR